MSRRAGDGKGKTGGRVKGTPNKVTAYAKEEIAAIVNTNAAKVQQMLDMVVEPEKWLHCYVKILEFVMPKQAAVKVTDVAKVSDLKSELAKWAEEEIK